MENQIEKRMESDMETGKIIGIVKWSVEEKPRPYQGSTRALDYITLVCIMVVQSVAFFDPACSAASCFGGHHHSVAPVLTSLHKEIFGHRGSHLSHYYQRTSNLVVSIIGISPCR